MQWTIPGTTLLGQREDADRVDSVFRALFLAGGLTLSQVSGIAGLMLSFYVGSSTGASITLCLAVFLAVTFCFRHRK